MVKYSFIVPVYNTKKYLKKCLDSLVKQTFKDFEVIVVNDGSTDESLEIIEKYKNKYSNIKVINQKNQGLSMARNNGVLKARGDYILFVDSDDYIEKDLLKEVDKNIGNADVLRFQIFTEDENYKNKEKIVEHSFEETTGPVAFEKICDYKYVEPAWCYVIKTKYYKENKFEFKKDMYHEDFGLMPYVIYKAKIVKGISYVGYHYITRSGSIMNNSSYDKTIKKAFDMLTQYKELRAKVKATNKNMNNYYLSYISNCAIVKAKTLRKKERKEYIKELKNIKAYNDVLVNSFSRKIKKSIMKFSFELYLKVAK